MPFTLESIQFRIPGANNGAFNISVPGNPGQSRVIITGPEWQLGNNWPAAFAMQATSPFIDVSFLCSDMGLVQAQIQATAVNGHVLGDIAPVNADFQNGRFACRIGLNAAQINAVGHSTIQWRWQVTAGQDNSTFESQHEIYTTIAPPQTPWEVDGTDPTAAPWKEALDLACEWANGASTSEEILGAICTHHYHSGLLQYGSDSFTEGSDGTIEGGIFKLDKFLWYQKNNVKGNVDCADCATTVTIFGGLLGAKCVAVEICTDEDTKFRPADGTILVGGSQVLEDFNHHEVAMNVDDADTALVWDFCLGRNVSGTAQPYTNLRFRRANDSATYPAIAFIPEDNDVIDLVGPELRQIRDIAPIFNMSRDIHPTKYEFEQWQNRFTDLVGLAFFNLAPLAIDFAPLAITQLLPLQAWVYQKQPKPWLIDSVYRLDTETIQVGIFECESRSDAHLALYYLLDARRVKPLLEWQDVSIGDVLFYDSNQKSDLLLFARGNLTIRIQRNRGSQLFLLDVAKAIDDILMHGIALAKDAIPVAAQIAHESFPIALEGAASSLRFISKAAQIVLSGRTPALLK